ncbi:EF-hand domain-containing protein [Novosphingobium sp. AP12]|uniref:EF-hand domain-containing protein n=1 Tax=Novosphingobium sp. AP12 TaxID=1144305 RepID=UPI0002721455|nr:EF-hand domain-containing protein [Novosphingobium sp. AP12]EJL35008.1 hypothetical protein PMI02_00382 [Novosphingobium sp. AP12]
MYRIILGALALSVAPTAHAQMGSGGGGERGIMATADANKDGLVSRDEYRASRSAKFGRLDRNGDGAVSKEDYARLAKVRPEAAQKLDTLITEPDKNKDGKVTRAEYDAMPMPMFERADTDGDGSVDKVEMAAAQAQTKAMMDAR